VRERRRPTCVQAEYFPDTRSSGVTLDQLASGTSSVASGMGGRSHCSGDEVVERLVQCSAADATNHRRTLPSETRLATACDKANRAAVVAAVADMLRSLEETASQTCTMATVVFRFTFAYVRKGVWVSYPDPIRSCTNVAVTRTLRANASTPSNWNYTEVTVAKPPKDSLCRAESGTTEFTWRQAFTASPLKCRYVEM
jgi:hypothetical protein